MACGLRVHKLTCEWEARTGRSPPRPRIGAFGPPCKGSNKRSEGFCFFFEKFAQNSQFRHCLLLIRLALAKHTNETAVVTRQVLHEYAAAAVGGQMKTRLPIATVRIYTKRTSLQNDTPSLYTAVQAGSVVGIIVSLQACMPPVTDALLYRIVESSRLRIPRSLVRIAAATLGGYVLATARRRLPCWTCCLPRPVCSHHHGNSRVSPNGGRTEHQGHTLCSKDCTEQPANRHCRTSCAR
jgi:hypothetical protein